LSARLRLAPLETRNETFSEKKEREREREKEKEWK
jgi:hypothetical protein